MSSEFSKSTDTLSEVFGSENVISDNENKLVLGLPDRTARQKQVDGTLLKVVPYQVHLDTA